MLNDKSQVPLLKKVVVASGNKVAIGNNIEEAIANLLSQEAISIEVEAEDKNELRESFIRDAVSFCSLYFLGDYVAKGTATLLEKMNKDVKLLNRFTKPDKNAKLHDKIKAWTKDTDLKSFDEIKGKKATNLRSVAQAAGIAFSIIVLGIILPFYNRKITEKKVRQQKEMEAQNQNNNIHA